MSFDSNLKEERRKRGWSQDQAAKQIDIARHNLGAYEEARAFPRAAALKKILDTYQPTNIYHFLFGEEASLNV